MSIRNKLILMLAIPLAALALVGAIGFRGQSSASRNSAEALQNDNVVQSLNRAVNAVGSERLAVAFGTSGLDLEDLRQATDESLISAIELADLADQLPLIDDAVDDAIRDVAQARTAFSLEEAVAEFSHATADLRMARDNVPVEYPSAESFAEATSIDLAVDIADLQDTIWLEYIAAERISPELAADLRTQIATTNLLRDQIIEIAPSEHTALLNATIGSDADAAIDRAGQVALDRFERDEGPLPDGPTLDTVTSSHDAWYGHAISLQDDVTADLVNRSADADDRQNLFALLGTLGLLVLFGLIYVVYRSVVRPLEDLLVGAEEVATQRLPAVVAELRTMGSSDANVHLEPLPRETDDELGSLVDAFNDVQLTAFDLAVEQARSRRNTSEMFVNLGRRNQKLLQRMLGTISNLEHDEKDPDKLEQLFQLDHMTTRMRRNAESLLVVAGTTSPRQWAKPIPAAEVVRSALAEVQDYHRVDILSLADAPIAGNAVADITHLLAELLENSLQFSDPGSRVSISSRWKDENYRIVITDQGFGMTAEELYENNDLISNPPPPDQAPTRFLGLFVVGHLARRHSISVELIDAAIGGTDARILIPATVMSSSSPSTTTALELSSSEAEEDLDLDAELAALTAETDVQREAEIVAGDLPVRSAETVIAEDEIAELPVRGQAVEAETLEAETLEAETLEAETLEAETVEAEAIDDEAIDAELLEMLAQDDDAVVAETVEADLPDLPVRGEAPIDFSDAELPELPTRDTAFTEIVEADLPDLPVRGGTTNEIVEADLPDLPVRGTAFTEIAEADLPDLPVSGATTNEIVEADLPDLPVRGTAFTEIVEADVPDLPFRVETPIDFGDVPELPHFDAVQLEPVVDPLPTRSAPADPAPAAPAPAAAAPVATPAALPDLPVRGQQPVPAPDAAPTPEPVPAHAAAGAHAVAGGASEALGLPQRTPRATLQEVAPPLPVVGASATTEIEDVSTTATTVSSMFSAFQSGVQRGEQTTK